MATIPAVAPEAPEPAKISAFGRLIGVFFSPKGTFEDIARRPSWVLPVVVMTVLGIATAFVMNQKVDWREVASKRIEESPRAANMSADQKEQQLAMSAKISPAIAYVFGTIGPILAVVIVAAVMLLVYNMIGGASATFGQAMGVVSHAFFVTIIGTVFLIAILYLKPPGTVDLDNPVATNVGAFLPESTPKPVQALAKSIDIFSIWQLLLIAVGFTAINAKKLKGKALSLALIPWAVWVAVKMAGAWIFS
ncbi:MAG TPA: YIP1 family protein [Dongiaceae bacterium]|nr:YIP1 family protein [Dongiaceae bacterium]